MPSADHAWVATAPDPAPRRHTPSPFWDVSREDWAQLATGLASPLSAAEISALRGLGDPMDVGEVSAIYLPVSLLLNHYVTTNQRLHERLRRFLGTRETNTPYVIGVAGSVAVGKSTVARVLQELLSRWDSTPRVSLVTTDGFLLPNKTLQERNLMERKGFPESYDLPALLRFITAIKSGEPRVRAPYYSHSRYDIVPDREVVVEHPDVLILEGLNVLQSPELDQQASVSDLIDFGVYIDARTSDIERWYIDRFMKLQQEAFPDPHAYFHKYAALGPREAAETARDIWRSVNLPNLEQNIARTKARARLILQKDADHSVHRILLRKL
ncbi:MAG: type I pantothenate kinase [Microbacteriaceae bacterium]|nr:type I pantothenate kinase [Microbacteriaceae bacterium]MCI1206901.1 type I pantothenate kinase [Microbacteriaceae bacterium]